MRVYDLIHPLMYSAYFTDVVIGNRGYDYSLHRDAFEEMWSGRPDVIPAKFVDKEVIGISACTKSCGDKGYSCVRLEVK